MFVAYAGLFCPADLASETLKREVSNLFNSNNATETKMLHITKTAFVISV